MADYKVIKGQAWIDGNALVQEQVMIIPGKTSTTNTVCLIEDIWEDLTSASGTYRAGKPGYFFWEVTMTDSENDENEITINFECPKPKEGLFTEPYNPDAVDGEYAKYWVEKMRIASENYEKEYAIQRKEVLLKGTTYLDYNMDPVTIEDKVEKNTGFGDIMNLLNLF